MNNRCPACGSHRVRSSVSRPSIAAPMGPPVAYDALTDTCEDCSESGDFAGANDERIEWALQESARLSLSGIIDGLESRGMMVPYVERALGLPSGTLERWSDEGCSAGEAALMRMVSAFPWLLDAADHGYKKRRLPAKFSDPEWQARYARDLREDQEKLRELDEAWSDTLLDGLNPRLKDEA